MNASDLYYSLNPSPLTEFGKHFSDFQTSAFRLEMLSKYTVTEEAEVFDSFLAGQPGPPADFNQGWRDLLTEGRSAGKSFSRVRIIDGALSRYLKFELQWAYPGNIRAGEDIRFIHRPEVAPFDTFVPILQDYWLFDEQTCFLMEYDYCGTFLGVIKVPENLVTYYIALMNEVKRRSLSIEELLKNQTEALS